MPCYFYVLFDDIIWFETIEFLFVFAVFEFFREPW